MLVPSVVLPQRHSVTDLPPSEAVTAAPLISGTRVTTLVSMSASPKFRAVTVTLPTASVTTLATYLLPEPLATSQPQLPARDAGRVVLEYVWITSVIVVRQAEAA